MGKLLTMKQTADHLDITVKDLKGLIAAGRLSYLHFGFGTQRKMRRFNIEDVEDLRISLECDTRRLATVYVVGFDKYAKIGWTTNFVQRLEVLTLNAPLPLETFATFPGTKKSERDLHSRFAEYRTRGEWFLNEGELAAWIREGCPL